MKRFLAKINNFNDKVLNWIKILIFIGHTAGFGVGMGVLFNAFWLIFTDFKNVVPYLSMLCWSALICAMNIISLYKYTLWAGSFRKVAIFAVHTAFSIWFLSAIVVPYFGVLSTVLTLCLLVINYTSICLNFWVPSLRIVEQKSLQN